MATIEERAMGLSDKAKATYHNEAYSNGIYAGYVKGAHDQKTIDIDKACVCHCDNICEIGRSGMCNHKYDGEGQIKSTFKYNECNELQLIRRIMEE